MLAAEEFFGGQATIEVFGKIAQEVKPVYFSPWDITISDTYTDELTNVESAGKDPERRWRRRPHGCRTSAAPPGGARVTVSNKNRRWRYLPQYLAVAPFFVLFAVFGLYPVLYSLFLSLQRWDGVSPMRFVGLENFRFLLTDTAFWDSIGNTLIIWVMSTIPMLVLSMLVALGLNSSVRHRGLLRIAYFLPNVTSIVAMSLVFGSFFSNEFGVLNWAPRHPRRRSGAVAERSVGDPHRDLVDDHLALDRATTRSSCSPASRRCPPTCTRPRSWTARGPYRRSSA